MKKYWLAAPAAAVLTVFMALAADDEPKAVKPVNLDCNTKADEDDPHVSSNGTTLYYTSNAKKLDDKGDNFDLYVTYRDGPTKEFAPPEAMAVLDTPADEMEPWLTKDGKTLYFTRETKEGLRVFAASRKKATGAQGFEDPVL